MIIFTFAIVLVLLPLGLTGVRQICDYILISRARNFQDQLLPAAYRCLDIGALAEGRPVLNTAQAESLIRSRFDQNMPASLKNRLRIIKITITEQKLQPDPGHWMGGSQPLRLPVIILYVGFLDHQGNEILLCSEIEMLTD